MIHTAPLVPSLPPLLAIVREQLATVRCSEGRPDQTGRCHRLIGIVDFVTGELTCHCDRCKAEHRFKLDASEMTRLASLLQEGAI